MKIIIFDRRVLALQKNPYFCTLKYLALKYDKSRSYPH